MTEAHQRLRAAHWLAWPLLGLIALYRYAVSPLLGVRCRFQPTCSEYAREALLRYGLFRGGWLALTRIGRCHPWGRAGHDPLPPDADRCDAVRVRDADESG